MIKLEHFLWFFLIAMMGVFICVLIFAYWLFFPYKVFEVKNFSYTDPIHIETPVVHPGDVLHYTINYCKYMDVPAIVYKNMIDGQKVTLVPQVGNLPIGCSDGLQGTTQVPETVNPGRYYLDVNLAYKVNPIRTVNVHYYTEYFQVVDEDMPSTSSPPPDQVQKILPSRPAVDLLQGQK